MNWPEKVLARPCIGANLRVVTWKTLSNLLASEFQRIRRMPVVTFGFANAPVTSVEEMGAEEMRHAERVDSLVRDFARTRRWPSLDEKERFYLRERIRFAHEYCRIAETSASRPLTLAGRPNVGREDRRLIEWLLIDVWRNSGVLNWMEPLYQILESSSHSDSSPDLQISE